MIIKCFAHEVDDLKEWLRDSNRVINHSAYENEGNTFVVEVRKKEEFTEFSIQSSTEYEHIVRAIVESSEIAVISHSEYRLDDTIFIATIRVNEE